MARIPTPVRLALCAVAAAALALGASACGDDDEAATTTESSAPCTQDALDAAVAPQKVLTFACKDGFAAGAQQSQDAEAIESAFLLRSVGGEWRAADLDEACQDGNPLDIPANVLDASPCKVS